MTEGLLTSRRPVLVAAAAAASAIVGVGVTARWVSDPPLAVAGLLLVGLAVGLWLGFGWARPVGLVAGAAALLPLGWGVSGLAVITGQWFDCADARLAVASLVATSYPSGFCAMRDWPVAFGTGFGLVGVGLAGLLVVAAVARERRYFATRADRDAFRG